MGGQTKLERNRKKKKQRQLTGSDQATTPAEALASQDALEQVPLLAVGAEHEADLTAPDADVASRHVGVSANVPAQLAHEGNAEPADLGVTLALRIEVGPTL